MRPFEHHSFAPSCAATTRTSGREKKKKKRVYIPPSDAFSLFFLGVFVVTTYYGVGEAIIQVAHVRRKIFVLGAMLGIGKYFARRFAVCVSRNLLLTDHLNSVSLVLQRAMSCAKEMKQCNMATASSLFGARR